MYALMVKDDYTDLVLDHKYEVDTIYADKKHMKIKGSPRRYLMDSFIIYDEKGNVLNKTKAYKCYLIDRTIGKFKNKEAR